MSDELRSGASYPVTLDVTIDGRTIHLQVERSSDGTLTVTCADAPTWSACGTSEALLIDAAMDDLPELLAQRRRDGIRALD